MKKETLLLLVLLVAVPACSKKSSTKTKKKTQDVYSQVDIPLAGDEEFTVADESVRSFFEADVDEFQEEFALAEPQESGMSVDAEQDKQDFAWVEQEEVNSQAVLFDFDKYTVRADQEPVVEQDIAYAQKALADESVAQAQPTVVIEGHACHSAGSDIYNLALSEKRAKVVADRFVNSGVARDNIKVVGRGAHVPAIVDGKEVTGDRTAQALNRRVEVHAIYS